MLERMTIRNFKQFEDVSIDLGGAVVFVGPNNAGKTSALQALALWKLGVDRWAARHSGRQTPKERSAITLNRRDLLALPVPETNLLWRNRHVRASTAGDGRRQTRNVRVDVAVEGVSSGAAWRWGMEFDYPNPESIYCRPSGWADAVSRPGTYAVPQGALDTSVAFLPPMSGLAAEETLLTPGTVQVLLGQGRTAEVLRNLCHQLSARDDQEEWKNLVERVRETFGVTLGIPTVLPDRGEVVMTYRDRGGVELDLSAAGRGLQQCVLLLAWLLGRRHAVLLLDEPDAHLEVLRQRRVYNLLVEVAASRDCQVIAATHSEVLLNEAADRHVVVSFVGRPHRIDDRSSERSQVLKSLKSIGFDQYQQAEQTGWVLYLEGSTDLALLRALARALGHPAAAALEQPFVHYVQNQPQLARDHFHGLRHAVPHLVGVLVTDHQQRALSPTPELDEWMWPRNEIENYVAMPEVLYRYAEHLADTRSPGALFAAGERKRLRELMEQAVRARVAPAALANPLDRWWRTVKASDDFLDPVFEDFYRSLGLPNLMRKADYDQLAPHVPPELIDPDVQQALDRIEATAQRARPAETTSAGEDGAG